MMFAPRPMITTLPSSARCKIVSAVFRTNVHVDGCSPNSSSSVSDMLDIRSSGMNLASRAGRSWSSNTRSTRFRSKIVHGGEPAGARPWSTAINSSATTCDPAPA